MANKSHAMERVRVGDMLVISRFNNARLFRGKGVPMGVAINSAKRGADVFWVTTAAIGTGITAEFIGVGQVVVINKG